MEDSIINNERYTVIDEPILPLSVSLPKKPFESIQKQNEEIFQMAMEGNKKKQQKFEDTHKIAQNTDIMIQSLSDQVTLQKKYIELLELNNNAQKEQLGILNNLFASNEDSAIVAKEILTIMQQQDNVNDSMKSFLADKGVDVLLAVLPALWTYLQKQGFHL